MSLRQRTRTSRGRTRGESSLDRIPRSRGKKIILLRSKVESSLEENGRKKKKGLKFCETRLSAIKTRAMDFSFVFGAAESHKSGARALSTCEWGLAGASARIFCTSRDWIRLVSVFPQVSRSTNAQSRPLLQSSINMLHFQTTRDAN